MITETLRNQFIALFDGRRDAVGSDEGRAIRIPEDEFSSLIDDHLNVPGRAIGVYPLFWSTVRRDWRVLWGCVDLDVAKPGAEYQTEQEAHEAALRLQRTLDVAAGVASWVEVTRSHGRHVWVFASQSVEAAIMRRALPVACEIAGVTSREVNPKSEGFDERERLGNYVRLPYPAGVTDNRYISTLTLEGFVHEAWDARTRPAPLEEFARLWVAPVAPRARVTGEVPVLDRALTRRMGGLTWTVFSNGPLEGSDRSGTLFKLAALCHDDELSPEEALAIITAADEAWGKFHDRADCDRQLNNIIDRTYGGDA
jgi:hypothetical protein